MTLAKNTSRAKKIKDTDDRDNCFGSRKMPSILEPPFVQVEGISNFRSIGGYPIISSSSTSGKRSTRHNFIYRSAAPSSITSAGRSKILSLGITTVYDFRSKPEVDRQLAKEPASATPLAEGVVYRFVPVFADQDWSPEAIAERHCAYADSTSAADFARAYAPILEHGGGAFREILLHVRDRPADALLCHCSAGKDRTGVLVAILLKIAGCADEIVAREYELSELGLTAVKELIVEYLMKSEGLRGREKAERVAGAK